MLFLLIREGGFAEGGGGESGGLLEKTGEVVGIGHADLMGNFIQRVGGVQKQLLGFFQSEGAEIGVGRNTHTLAEHMGKTPGTHAALGGHILQRNITAYVVADPKLNLLHLLALTVGNIGDTGRNTAGEDHQKLLQVGCAAMLIDALLKG